MDSWIPRISSSWNVVRQASKAESRADSSSSYRTADGLFPHQNISNDQRSRRPWLDDPWIRSQEIGVSQQENRELTLNIGHSDQLMGRKDSKDYLNPRGFEATRTLNSSWKRWRRRQNSGGGDDQINGFSPETTPDFKSFAFAKPIYTAPNNNKEVKTPSYLSIMKPRTLKQVEKTWTIPETKRMSLESRESNDDTPSDESIETIASNVEVKTDVTLDKVPCIPSRRSYYPPTRALVQWLKGNHQIQVDLLTRIDKNEGDGLSYDEFVQHLEDMGAPGSKDELYDMAFVLDTNQDQLINYQEVKKLNRRLRAFVNNNEFMNQKYESLPGLRPCSKCKIGLFEPTRTRNHRFISLVLKNFVIKGIQKSSLIGQFIFDVGPDFSIYGIQRMVNTELGGSAIRIRILRSGNQKVEVLDHMKTLEYYGYKGSTVRERPQVVELFYDYDYPRLDCPLLLANLSR